MSADPKKLAAMVVEGLPPPDRLKKKAPPEEGEGEEDMGGGGVSAMDSFKAAMEEGDARGMFEALKTAVEYCKD